MRQAKPICLVTGNQKKLDEFQLLVNENFVWTHQKLDIPELQGTPLEVAVEKCRLAAKLYNGPVITEDDSFFCNAWGELPSVYIKHFIDSVGAAGLVKMLQQFEDKTCYAQRIFCYCEGPQSEPVPFVGKKKGRIVAPRGSGGWGLGTFDTILEIDGQTYAEMLPQELRKVSFRVEAGNQLVEFLSKQ